MGGHSKQQLVAVPMPTPGLTPVPRHPEASMVHVGGSRGGGGGLEGAPTMNGNGAASSAAIRRMEDVRLRQLMDEVESHRSARQQQSSLVAQMEVDAERLRLEWEQANREAAAHAERADRYVGRGRLWPECRELLAERIIILKTLLKKRKRP